MNAADAATLAVHCSCVDSRRSSGPGHGVHTVVPRDEFAATGTVSCYERLAISGNVVSRGFCGRCGSPVHSTDSSRPEEVYLRASVLDEPERIRPQMIVFASAAPSWDVPPVGIPAFETMPDPSQARPETR